MILYITDSEHKNLLNWLEQDVQVRIYHEPDMQIKFRKELPYMATVSHVIVNGSGIDMSTWKEAVELLQAAKAIPLLLLIEDGTVPETYQRQEGYAILNQAHKDIKKELSQWLEQKEDIAHTWIGVAGLSPSAGTTAFAMHMAGYITSQKQRVAVTELGDIFPILADYYGWDELEPAGWNWGGTNYYHHSIDEASPYTVLDLGVMNQKVHALWKRCEIKILVVDGKPYRLEHLGEQLRELQKFPGNIYLVFNFVPETEKPLLRKRYSSERVTVWFAPYQPDLYEVSEVYQELLDGYLKPVEVSKKKRFELPKLPEYHRGKKLASIGILLLAAGIGIGSISSIGSHAGRQRVEIDTIPVMDFTATTKIRLMLAEESAGQEGLTLPTEQMPETETAETTEVSAQTSESGQKTTEKPDKTKNEDNTAKADTKMTEASSEADTQAPVTATEIQVPLTPSLSGYQGQIYTGSEVVAIMNQYTGAYVAMHLVTRSSDGWYNYDINGLSAGAVSNGTAQVDTGCSFLCQVLQVNGEDVGLEFLQQ